MKTNKIIANPILRSVYARELWEARKMKKMDCWYIFRAGMESSFWAMEKEIRNGNLAIGRNLGTSGS